MGAVQAERTVARALLAACALFTLACGRAPVAGTVAPAHAPSAARSTSAVDPKHITIVFLGDSLTAGYGLRSDQAFPSRIQDLFAADGYRDVEIVNAGVSGDTTAGGLERVADLLQPSVKILVVALGGNDALRGLSPAQTHDNLAAIIDAAETRGVAVFFAGMEAPTNLGPDYQTAFHGAFTRIEAEYQGKITSVPFLLAGVAGVASLNQADGIHPNDAGARKVADLLYPPLQNLVDRIAVTPQT